MTQRSRYRGLLAWFAENHVAANLLMLFVLSAGGITLARIPIELYPSITFDRISIDVLYPGATPTEVEQGVCLRIEEAVDGITGIKRITSHAIEGQAKVRLELEEAADHQSTFEQVKAAIDRITAFPQEIEKPTFTLHETRQRILSVVVFGNVSEPTLQRQAEHIQEELLALEGISQVSLFGYQRPEIAIEVSEEALRRYGLSFETIAAEVGNSSLDLPAGSVKTAGGEILIRTLGQRYVGRQFEEIVVLTRTDGTVLRLADIATVIDGFEETDIGSLFDGQPAVEIRALGRGNQQILELARTIKQYVEQKQPTLPKGLSLAIWRDNSESLHGRLSLLMRNAQVGAVLVITCLALFLDLRLAFWTMMGMVVAFMGTFWLMPLLDISINMVSLFALLMMLGLVVDDAIVVSENIFAQREAGRGPLEAAVWGVREMAAPVILAVLTTVLAFAPLIFVGGWLGKFLKSIPILVICILLVSLIEALLVLPAHLSTLPGGRIARTRGVMGPLVRLQHHVRTGLHRIIHGPYLWALRRAITWPYVTAALSLSLFLITLGFVAGGHIQFTFVSPIESDNVWATLTMPQGTPAAQTRAVLSRIEHAAHQLREESAEQLDPAQLPLIKHVWTTIGMQPFGDDVWGEPPGAPGPHMAEVSLQLSESADRPISATQLANRWRERVGDVPGVKSLRFSSVMFSAGEAIHVDLSHPDPETVLRAADRLKARLRSYTGVTDITDSSTSGKVELQLTLTEQGRTLGLTSADLAQQVRQGFYGYEVQRIQRGRNEVRVMVRYPKMERLTIADLEHTRIRTPDGAQVPFSTVARVTSGRGYAAITRVERQRVITVTAHVDDAVANATEINRTLTASVLPSLQREFPGLTYRFGGAAREQRVSFGSLRTSFLLALLAIFALLAVHFRSYSQPLIIMSAIPFGIIGAVVGHLLLGFDLSLVSGFGVVALAGVVVNDSLIMVDVINRHRHEMGSLTEVLLLAGTKRFRPILLTTLTTFFGLMPLIFEQSVQARFLIPMAVTLAFGVVFATVITLLLVPVFYVILEDMVVGYKKFTSSNER